MPANIPPEIREAIESMIGYLADSKWRDAAENCDYDDPDTCPIEALDRYIYGDVRRVREWLTQGDNKPAEIDAVKAIDVLREFVGDVNATGGLLRWTNGNVSPAAENDDDPWTDLGVTYLKACEVLGVKPEYDAEDDEIDDGGTEEGDYVTDDHRRFFQYGELVVEVPEDEDWEPHVKAHMDSQEFWPNVWFISDHGNTVLLSIGGDE